MSETRRSIGEHLTQVLALAGDPPTVITPVEDAVGQILAVDAVADLAVPPFSNSAMDGFLVHGQDLSPDQPVTIDVVGDVPAGGIARAVSRGQAVRIMTGAPVGDPVPADLQVIPVELTNLASGPQPLPAQVIIQLGGHHRTHIRRRGENARPGEVAVSAGTRIDPGAVAALISVGVSTVSVHRLPRVAILSSGDELVPAGQKPAAGQLPDSNQPMLAALLNAEGVGEVSRIHTSDSPAEFRASLDRAAAAADLVITTGGVSAGAFDVVREVAGEADVWFGPVAMQPGKPQGLGIWAGTPLICLPGNPVAVFVSFHLFVSPLLRALAGEPVPPEVFARPNVAAVPGAGFPVPKGRPLLVPVALDWHSGQPVARPFNPAGVGSHLVASLAGVDGLAVLSPGVETETVRVLLFR